MFMNIWEHSVNCNRVKSANCLNLAFLCDLEMINTIDIPHGGCG